MRSTLVALTVVMLPGAVLADTDLAVSAGLEYDDNLFLLDDKQAEKLDTGDSKNDRWDGMESSNDLIVVAGARVDLEAKKLANRTTRLRIEPGLALHLKNSKCSHAAVDASLDQRLWKGGSVYLRADLVPYRFKKNYFADGRDQDADGDVSGSEKDYEPGVTSEALAAAGVRTEIGKPVEVYFEAGAGAELWGSPFKNRDEQLLLLEGGADVKVGKKLKLSGGYQMINSTAPGDEEVILNDRTRVVTAVDRSYTSGRVAAGVGVELTKALDLRAGASLRQRTYTSTGADDPYADRVDQRLALGVGVRVQAGNLTVNAGIERTQNDTERPNDPDRSNDQEQDYVKNVVRAVATFRF